MPSKRSGNASASTSLFVVAKCGDSIPIYRLEKSFRRLGVPVARSTMTDLFHRAAELLEPLVARMLALVRAAPVVRADETSIKMLGTEKRAFMWAFLCDEPAPIITYRFSPSRSGDTPAEVLGGSTGALVVDMYTGYNQITAPGGRTRAACLAHARRHLFEALATAPHSSAGQRILGKRFGPTSNGFVPLESSAITKTNSTRIAPL